MHEEFMLIALEEAKKAAESGEVPVGAVLVDGGVVLARSHNLTEKERDPTSHAEINVIRDACRLLGDWRLDGTTLYVTKEPCPMCAGAIVISRIKLLVFGAADIKSGAAGSVYNIVQDGSLNHKVLVIGGILEDECVSLLRNFFSSLR